jgi:hypothetical protein
VKGIFFSKTINRNKNDLDFAHGLKFSILVVKESNSRNPMDFWNDIKTKTKLIFR